METTAPQTGPLFTIGHSNRSLDEFIGLLQEQGIGYLIDVRSYPFSRHNPLFSRDALTLNLKDEGIEYLWEGESLGGFRRERPDSPHSALPQATLRGYADHMGGPEFQQAIGRLLELADHRKVAIMCAERDPGQCHRSLIADYLTLNNCNVIHLIAPAQCLGHCLNPLARAVDGQPVYDCLGEEQLNLSF